jgi:glutathione S-transferase
MEITIIFILLALIQYLGFTFKVGTTRAKLKVQAPHITGDESWERMFRVQQNTLEQLIIFIPAMLIFAHYVSPLWVALPGAAFLIGRQIYSIKYQQDPKSRTLGFALTILSNIGLVLVSLAMIVWNLVA